jgi:hypothetical protein
VRALSFFLVFFKKEILFFLFFFFPPCRTGLAALIGELGCVGGLGGDGMDRDPLYANGKKEGKSFEAAEVAEF